jgi:hypothetical protein
MYHDLWHINNYENLLFWYLSKALIWTFPKGSHELYHTGWELEHDMIKLCKLHIKQQQFLYCSWLMQDSIFGPAGGLIGPAMLQCWLLSWNHIPTSKILMFLLFCWVSSIYLRWLVCPVLQFLRSFSSSYTCCSAKCGLWGLDQLLCWKHSGQHYTVSFTTI